MGYTVETSTQIGSKKLNTPQFVFHFDEFGDNKSQVHKLFQSRGLVHCRHYWLHPSNQIMSRTVRVCTVDDEHFAMIKMMVT